QSQSALASLNRLRPREAIPDALPLAFWQPRSRVAHRDLRHRTIRLVVRLIQGAGRDRRDRRANHDNDWPIAWRVLQRIVQIVAQRLFDTLRIGPDRYRSPIACLQADLPTGRADLWGVDGVAHNTDQIARLQTYFQPSRAYLFGVENVVHHT